MARNVLRSLDFGGVARVMNLPAPAGANDAARLVDVQSAIQGLSWKDAVRVATTVAGTLATSFENGDTVDGVVLATGDRILIKNQAAAQENGIYIVNASGAPTRATDFDDGTDPLGAAVFVMEGTTNAGTQWTLTTDAPITIDTTPLSFSQVGGGAGSGPGAGLVQNGPDHDVNVDGTTIEIVSDQLRVVQGVRKLKFAQDIGNGALTTIAVTHNLGTRDAHVVVYRNSGNFDEVDVEVQHTDANTVTLVFETAPTTNQFRVVVIA